MNRFLLVCIALGSFCFAFGQGGGGFGGGGMGGAAGGRAGGQQGREQRQYDESVQRIEEGLAKYLNGEEIKNVLTPGEFSEWKLTLKAGQVIIADARSDAFDPALEIVDDKDKVLASNDDRYPGDQRPLLLWRCPKDGEYAIHARCFHDKSGGQFFLRFRTYESVDLTPEGTAEKTLTTEENFLIRLQMKAGQLTTIYPDRRNPKEKLTEFSPLCVIAPNGLPNVNLTEELNSVNGAFMAPVAGDYYVFARLYRQSSAPSKIRIASQEFVAAPLARSGSTEAAGPTNTPGLWKLKVSAGDFLRVTMPELNLDSRVVVANVPDISKFDVSKPELNPFFPHPPEKDAPATAPIEILPGRDRDPRVVVFFVRRDGELWIATNASGKANVKYSVNVSPAAVPLDERDSAKGVLRIANTDYWEFNAQSGDVMALGSVAPGFNQQITVRDPDLRQIRNSVANPDQSKDYWQMIVQKPGRYLVAMSCYGDGGGGEYSLSRKVLHAKEFSKGSPASGELLPGQIQIWKFKATPGDPLYIHWRSSEENYSVAIYDDKGQPADFQRTSIDKQNRVGILNVTEPQTFVIVLTGRGKSTYSIELRDLPGVK